MDIITLDDFCIDKLPPTYSPTWWRVQSFIHRLNILSKVGAPFQISKPHGRGSGYRNPEYERDKNRSMYGAHTFGKMLDELELANQYWPDLRKGVEEGAADIVSWNWNKFLEVYRLSGMPFRRLCLYPQKKFVHLDMVYYEDIYDRRFYVDRGDGEGWERLDNFNDLFEYV